MAFEKSSMSARIGEKEAFWSTVVIRSHVYSKRFRRTSNVTGSSSGLGSISFGFSAADVDHQVPEAVHRSVRARRQGRASMSVLHDGGARQGRTLRQSIPIVYRATEP